MLALLTILLQLNLCMCVHTSPRACIQRSEVSFGEAVLSFHLLGGSVSFMILLFKFF